MAEEDTSPEPKAPQDFVVVLTYRSVDGEIEEDFGRMVNDIKALYTFKQDVRAYALVEESAKNVLALVEKPQGSDQTRVVLSYEAKDGESEEQVLSVAKNLNELLDAHPHLRDGLTIDSSAQVLLEKARTVSG